jgi:hypothetical protein
MTKGPHRVTRKRAPPGAPLAFLALALQVLIPFLVAYEISVLSSPAYAGDAIICSAAHAGSSHRSAPDHTDHGACPLCVTLAAAQAFTNAAPVPLPVPRQVESITLQAGPARLVTTLAAAPYNPRAPPALG